MRENRFNEPFPDPDFDKMLDGFADKPEAPGPTEIDFSVARRNDPCPCGSNRLFKHCCRPTLAKQAIIHRRNIGQAKAAIINRDVEKMAAAYELQLQGFVRARIMEVVGIVCEWHHIAHRVQRSVKADHSREWAFDGKAIVRIQAPTDGGDTFRVINLVAPGNSGG